MIENKLGIYVHIPFCFSKCPYCDFYSVGAGKARQELRGEYIEAVKKEIGDFFERNAGKYDVDTIYFGGGTPNSLLADELHEILDFILENAGLKEQDSGLKKDAELKEQDGGLKKDAELKEQDGVMEEQDDASDDAPAKGKSGIKPEITIEVNPKPFKKRKDLLEENTSGMCAEKTDAAAEGNFFDTDESVEDRAAHEKAFGRDGTDCSRTDFKALRQMGFNRLSIGTQSFDQAILKKLGRPHSVEDNIETVRLAKEAGFDNISLDLMFGIPGQTEEVWEDTVRQAIALDCQHISMYSLEFMEGTRFTKMLEEGKMHETPEEDDRRMYHKAIEMLEAAGYIQYEISNFAKPGYESHHNSKYWMLEEYAGFGPSAHSYIANRRYSNPADLGIYIKDPLGKIVYSENTVFDDMSEFVFTGLRMSRGVDLEAFREKFGMDIWAAFDSAREEFEKFAAECYAEISEDRIRLTLKGFDISNKIMCLFV